MGSFRFRVVLLRCICEAIWRSIVTDFVLFVCHVVVATDRSRRDSSHGYVGVLLSAAIAHMTCIHRHSSSDFATSLLRHLDIHVRQPSQQDHDRRTRRDALRRGAVRVRLLHPDRVPEQATAHASPHDRRRDGAVQPEPVQQRQGVPVAPRDVGREVRLRHMCREMCDEQMQFVTKAGGTVVAQVDAAAGARVDPEHDPDRAAVLQRVSAGLAVDLLACRHWLMCACG